MRFWGSISPFEPDGVPHHGFRHLFCRNLNRIIRLTSAKTEMFEKVVQVDGIFLVIYFIDEIIRTTHANFQAKIFNTVGSRAPWRWLWRFDLLVGGSFMFPMTSQCNSIGGDEDFTMICFTDITDITESLWPTSITTAFLSYVIWTCVNATWRTLDQSSPMHRGYFDHWKPQKYIRNKLTKSPRLNHSYKTLYLIHMTNVIMVGYILYK